VITIHSLHIYPLKGGRGIDLDRVVLDRFGPTDDRRWLVVDPRGRQVTQREVARLCQVGAVPFPDRLVLSAPGAADLVVGRPTGLSSFSTRPVRVWNDRIEAIDLGPDPGRWCSEFLGREVGLVYLPDGARRRTDPEYDSIGGSVSFADGYPILLTTTASLEDLNRRLDVPVPMNRFRPNVVVTGTGPFEEDDWRRFSIGEVILDSVKPCARCVVTTTDQLTAVRGREPLAALARYRSRPAGAIFGVNVVHRSGGTVAIGDPVLLQQNA
jgi:uncharacterized protein YcbX